MRDITVFGCGISSEFDESKLKYNKIIIMTDADVDGAHIRILLLTFFFRFMRPLIEHGHVYAALPPLYMLTQGKEVRYAYDDDEKTKLLAEMQSKSKAPIVTQRYKGLGEMAAEQLWETTMNPANRILVRVTMDDAIEADETFSRLMGDDVELRRIFIEENAHRVTELDG